MAIDDKEFEQMLEEKTREKELAEKAKQDLESQGYNVTMVGNNIEDDDAKEIVAEPVIEDIETVSSDTVAQRVEEKQTALVARQEQVNQITQVVGDGIMASDTLAEALMTSKNNIAQKASEQINDRKIIDKHAKDMAEVVDKGIKVSIETQNLEVEKRNANNKATKKEIENQLFVLKEEAKRLKKEQQHLSALQKEEQKKENDRVYWANHGSTLTQYHMHEGSNRVFCNILLWLDGVKGFITGLGKVSTALLSALKWVLIAGGILAILNIIPVTREWLANLLGFMK